MRQRGNVLRPGAVGVGGAVLVMLLSSCGSSGGAGSADRLGTSAPSVAPVTPVTPSGGSGTDGIAPTDGPEGAVGRAALRTYQDWWAAQTEAFGRSDSDGSQMQAYSTGKALSEVLANLHQLHEAKLVMIGSPRNSPVAQELIQKYNLTLAEATAIGIYSAADYAYINPAVAGNEKWFYRQMPKAEFQNKTIQDEVVKGQPKKYVDPTKERIGEKKLSKKEIKKKRSKDRKEFGQAFKQHSQGAWAEGLEHSRIALSGLNKLPNWSGKTYRGLVLTPAEMEAKYPIGGVSIVEAFGSTSLLPQVPEAFINSNRKAGKVGVLLEMNLTKGKDIELLSKSKDEKEILLLPSSSFKVIKSTPMTIRSGKNSYQSYKIELQQIR